MPDLPEIVRLPFEGISDYHVHCDYSVDAEGTIAEFCEAALQRGLSEICFTTHYDTDHHVGYSDNFMMINGERKLTTPDNLERYIDEVRRTAEHYYAFGLSVKLGLEYGWYDECIEDATRLFERFEFDYKLCGIHTVDGKCFCGPDSFKKCVADCTMETFVKKYFDSAEQAAKSGLFDTLAHIGYYLRQGLINFGDALLTEHTKHQQRLFDALIATGTALEINTAALRHGQTGYYPPMSIVNAAKKAGVIVERLGSDAHHPSQLGFDFEAAVALVPSEITGSED